MIRKTRIKDFTKPGGQVAELDAADWMKLPAPYERADKPLRKLTDDQRKRMDATLDLSLIHISEPTRLLSISYAVFCLKKTRKTGVNETMSILDIHTTIRATTLHPNHVFHIP